MRREAEHVLRCVRERRLSEELGELGVERGEYVEEGEESLRVVEREGPRRFFGVRQRVCGSSERGWMVTMCGMVKYVSEASGMPMPRGQSITPVCRFGGHLKRR